MIYSSDYADAHNTKGERMSTGERNSAKTHKLQVYTVKEAADRLGIHPHTLRRWGNLGQIQEYRSYGTEKQRLYAVTEVERIAKLIAERERLRGEMWGDEEGEDDGTQAGP